MGSDPPPVPPPEAPLLCVRSLSASSEVDSPVSEAMSLSDMLLIMSSPPDVGEAIIIVALEPIMLESIIIEEPVIIAELAIMEADSIAPDAMAEAVLEMVGTALLTATPPTPACRSSICCIAVSLKVKDGVRQRKRYIRNGGGRSPIGIKQGGEQR
ncbi:MAG: hypothetical protein Q9216_001162 [Gyalolechia sp. 2 TL-2023]